MKKPPEVGRVEGAVTEIGKICENARKNILTELHDHAEENPYTAWCYSRVSRLEKTLGAMYQEWGDELKEVFQLRLPEVWQSGYDRACLDLKTSGVFQNLVGQPDLRRIRQALESVYTNVALRTDKMRMEHVSKLRRFSAKIFREAALTGETRKSIAARLMSEALQVPGFEFIGIDNRRWKNKSYFEMLARTELMNSARESYDAQCAENGCNIMRLSISGKCCSYCAAYEDKCFTLGPNDLGLPTKEDLIQNKVFHPNCTHSYSAVPMAIYLRDYAKDKVKQPEVKPDEKQPVRKPIVKPEVKPPIVKPLQSAQPSFSMLQPKSVKETHDEHVKRRREQWEQAYDNRRDRWHQSILDAGGSKEVAGVLADEYTQDVAKKLGKPPPIKFVKKERKTFCKQDGSYIQLHEDPNNWFGYPDTARHEFVHWKQYHAMKRGIISSSELVDAAKKDFDSFLKNCKDKGIDLNSFKPANVICTIAKMFPQLTTDANSCVLFKKISIADTIGMMSNGKYGCGHPAQYYKIQNRNAVWAQCEPLADLKIIERCIGESVFPFDFSNLRIILMKIGG